MNPLKPKQFLKCIFDAVTIPMCRLQKIGAFIDRLAYQRKRVLRREIEQRLAVRGLYNDTVQLGPFAGMRYPVLDDAYFRRQESKGEYASCRFEKIIGAYEHELHGLISEIATRKAYRHVVNVGAAEGYYAVGLARLFPNARHLAYESSAWSRTFCKKLAQLNDVDERLSIRGECTLSEFRFLNPEGPALVWMDIDLGEREMLDPVAVPWLRESDIAVELHECMKAGTNRLIIDRFEATHHIRQFTSTGHVYSNYPSLRELTFSEIYAMVGEDRPGLQDWLMMEPRSQGGE